MYGQSKIGLVYKEGKEEEIAFVVPLLHAWDSSGGISQTFWYDPNNKPLKHWPLFLVTDEEAEG